jgi:riboflavin biosynthesis pyrimidine reductase
LSFAALKGADAAAAGVLAARSGPALKSSALATSRLHNDCKGRVSSSACHLASTAPIRTDETARPSRVALAPGEPVAIVVDPSGKLHYQANTVGGGHRVIAILAETAADEYLQELRSAGVSYLFAGSAGNDLAKALDILHREFGLTSLLLEGGGIINATFLQAGLIDELSLLIYPGIDGLAGTPSIFEFHGDADSRPAAGQALRHIATEALDGGFVWLRYRVERLQSSGAQ